MGTSLASSLRNATPDFKRQFLEANAYLPAVYATLGNLPTRMFAGCHVADYEMDVKLATDLVILGLDKVEIALRIRNDGKFSHFKDMTIRSNSYPFTYTSELEKLRKGCTSHYFYGEGKRGKLNAWMLVDSNKLRSSGVLDVPRPEKWNAIDRTSGKKTAFISIPVDELEDAGCILASDLPWKFHYEVKNDSCSHSLTLEKVW